jgi:hypothetical protein
MHGTFLHRQGSFKRTEKCSVHGDPIICDPIVGTLLYVAGQAEPHVFPAVAERCPTCHPTIEGMMRFCVAAFMKNMKATGAPVRIEKIAILWKDGHRDEHVITE